MRIEKIKKEKINNKKLVKYLTRDYKLRDRSITIFALLHSRFLKEIYYTEALDVMTDGLITVYVSPNDTERINVDLAKAIKKDPDYISIALKEGIRTLNLVKETTEKKIKWNIDKKEALTLINEAEDNWNQFGSFLEFTHALGRINTKLSRSQLNTLGKFHNERKKVFLKFFVYLENICLSITKEYPEIKQEDLAYLTVNEIKKYFLGELETSKINNLQNIRKKGYLYYVSSKGAEELITDFNSMRAKELLLRIEDEKTPELNGTSVSKGVVKGEVKLISIDTKLGKENISQKIIVTTMTTPIMDTFLKKVGGIITEEGGILCHAAIFARETNIPTITLIKKVTNILKDGDLVEVDANNGVVKILKKG